MSRKAGNSVLKVFLCSMDKRGEKILQVVEAWKTLRHGAKASATTLVSLERWFHYCWMSTKVTTGGSKLPRQPIQPCCRVP